MNLNQEASQNVSQICDYTKGRGTVAREQCDGARCLAEVVALPAEVEDERQQQKDHQDRTPQRRALPNWRCYLPGQDLVPLAEVPIPHDTVDDERIVLGELLGGFPGTEDSH
jgi:hypothetical protein